MPVLANRDAGGEEDAFEGELSKRQSAGRRAIAAAGEQGKDACYHTHTHTRTHTHTAYYHQTSYYYLLITMLITICVYTYM